MAVFPTCPSPFEEWMPFEKQCTGFSSTMQSRYGETPVSPETSFCLGPGFVSLRTSSGLLPVSSMKSDWSTATATGVVSVVRLPGGSRAESWDRDHGLQCSPGPHRQSLPTPDWERHWEFSPCFVLPLVWYGHGDCECWKPPCV